MCGGHVLVLYNKYIYKFEVDCQGVKYLVIDWVDLEFIIIYLLYSLGGGGVLLL